MLDNTPNQPSKFMTKNWVEVNDGSYGAYNTGSQIKVKTSMIRSSLCDYRDAYILAKGTITVTNAVATGTAPNKRGKKVAFKNCTPFTKCKSEINNKEINYDKFIDADIMLKTLM